MVCPARMLDMEVVLEKPDFNAKKGHQRFKSFAEMQRSLEEAEEKIDEDPASSVCSLPQFGTFYHIPDLDSGFGRNGNHDNHPWVITTLNGSQSPIVTACPRTSSQTHVRGAGELLMPGGILEGLERDGIILLKIQRPFPISNFRGYKSIGTLPSIWQDKLRDVLLQLAREKIARESEAP